MMVYSLVLPFPPSTNHYWGTRGKARYLTDRAVEFRAAVAWRCKQAKVEPLQGRVSVMAWLCPPDRRRRDLDNFVGKAVLDALQHAGVYADDSQIDHLEVRRGGVVAGGRLDVIVGELGDAYLLNPALEQMGT